MATRLLVLFGSNDEEDLNEKLLPYYCNNYNAFKHVEITNEALKRIKERFKIPEKDIKKVIINDEIFSVFLNNIYSKYFLNKNEEKRNAMRYELKGHGYFNTDEEGKYRVYNYVHPSPRFDAIKVLEDCRVLDGMTPFMIKGETNLNYLKDNKRFSSLTAVVDLDGVWHDIECSSNEETIDELIKLADNIPHGTKMTVFHYHY